MAHGGKWKRYRRNSRSRTEEGKSKLSYLWCVVWGRLGRYTPVRTLCTCDSCGGARFVNAAGFGLWGSVGRSKRKGWPLHHGSQGNACSVIFCEKRECIVHLIPVPLITPTTQDLRTIVIKHSLVIKVFWLSNKKDARGTAPFKYSNQCEFAFPKEILQL